MTSSANPSRPASSRTIRVGALTRVEGEGALHVELRNGVAERVELNIYEPPRFFEAFLRGRAHTEPPDLLRGEVSPAGFFRNDGHRAVVVRHRSIQPHPRLRCHKERPPGCSLRGKWFRRPVHMVESAGWRVVIDKLAR